MLWKMALAAIAGLALLWAAGFDFRGAKGSMIGMADSAAESLTGSKFRS
jgi:hypothetical protein